MHRKEPDLNVAVFYYAFDIIYLEVLILRNCR